MYFYETNRRPRVKAQPGKQIDSLKVGLCLIFFAFELREPGVSNKLPSMPYAVRCGLEQVKQYYPFETYSEQLCVRLRNRHERTMC